MIKDLRKVISQPQNIKLYTLKTLRNSYIFNQIIKGKDIYLIKKLTGLSLESLSNYYL